MDLSPINHRGFADTIDHAYVGGVSLTHGCPRKHIWTFAAGASKDQPISTDSCPCDATINTHHLWVETISVNLDSTQGHQQAA